MLTISLMGEPNSEQIVTIFAKDGEKKYPYVIIPARINKIAEFGHGDRAKTWITDDGILCYQKISDGTSKPQKTAETHPVKSKNDARSKLFEKHKVF